MIRKLKIKLVTLAMAALIVLLTVIVTGMNLINYSSVVHEADTILSILSQNKGTFPDFDKNEKDRDEKMNRRFPYDMSPETPYTSRFFSVFLNESGEIISTDTKKIISVDDEAAAAYTQTVLKRNEKQGFVDEFRFIVRSEGSGSRIIFLDCTNSLDSFYIFLYASIEMSLAGIIIVFFVIFILSGRFIRPVAESYEKQKQFITDAGHEIKTPLTIINANVDLLEMEIGENESLADIQEQTNRLKSLTNDLVMLARMEESENTMQKIEFPISEVVEEAARPFHAIALQQNKEFVCNIQPMLTLKGNDHAIQQLVSVFMDNALKYSPSGGAVSLNLTKQNRAIHLMVFNTAETEIKQEQLAHVFDRFYRTDASRNSETGGHGIGLSIAKAIVTAHGGKIRAWTEDGRSFRISAELPM